MRQGGTWDRFVTLGGPGVAEADQEEKQYGPRMNTELASSLGEKQELWSRRNIEELAWQDRIASGEALNALHLYAEPQIG